MQDNTSPEERLLHLIRKGNSKESSVKPPEKKANKTAFAHRPFKLPKLKLPLPEDLSSRILLGVIAVLVVFLLLSFIIVSSGRIEQKVFMFSELAETEYFDEFETPGGAQDEAVEPVSYYAGPIASRDLFTAKAATAEKEKPLPNVMQKISKLRLQGIISGLDPQAIIEDIQTKQTHFLSVGERIGDIELREILPGKVILYYYGQEVELGL